MAYHPSLDYFLVIVKYMNITRASEELHISQQSLSIYLKRLENFYNVPLFYRKPTLKLTPAGEILAETAKSIQSLYDVTYQKLNSLKNKPQKLIFGCSHVRYMQVLKILSFEEYHLQHPEVEIEFIEANSYSLKRMLSNGDINLFFGHKSPDCSRMQTIELKSNNLFVAISNDLMNSIFGSESSFLDQKWKDGVELVEFKNIPYLSYLQSHVSDVMKKYADSNGFSWKVVSDTANQNLNLNFCRQNMGFTLFDSSITSSVPDGVNIYPIKAPVVTYSLAFMRQNKSHERYEDDLWKLIQKSCASYNFQ